MEVTYVVVLGALVIGAGSFVQGVTGFGMGLVAVPFLAFLMPERLPQILLALMIPATVWHLIVERRSLHLRSVAWVMSGRVLGTAPGVLLITVLSEQGLQIVFGVLTLIAVLIMLASGRQVQVTTGTELGMGILSGTMATSASVGGPPLVMLYANRSVSEVRALISGVVLPGTIVSVGGLWLAGRFGAADVSMSAILFVPMLIGMALSRRVVRWVDQDRFRTTVLIVVAVTALLLVGRGVANSLT